MSARPEHYGELTQLISGLLDGRLSPEERARLELLLESDPAARGLYLQMIDQEIELECLIVPAGAVQPLPPAPVLAPSRSVRRSFLVIAAAAIVAFLLFLWLGRETGRAPIRPSQSAATFWSADFESGAAPGWTGQLVSADLPEGSRHGLRAIATTESHGVFYKIAPPEDWRGGIVALTDRSTLHITYRIGSANWMNVFLHTLGADPDQPAMFQLVGSRFPGPAGQWQTASIPFARFQRKVWDAVAGNLAFTGGGPRDGERIGALIFSAPHPIDLVIDRIWITADGAGAETILPHP